jgi:hypothetical protein
MLGYCKIIVDKEHSYVLSLNVLLHYVSNILILYDLWGFPVYKTLLLLNFLALLTIFPFLPVRAWAQEEYPRPISEYMEEVSPGKITVLSYPKYYRDSSGNLQKTETQLVPSPHPEWDYQVSRGIWQLRVRKDGTFQAGHAGDTFTYRLSAIGIGNGSQFRAIDLGPPNYQNISVVGDTIRWNDIFANVDLVVRYIHDILKVDVVIKRKFMRNLREDLKANRMKKMDFLTARFEIPSIIVTSQAGKQGRPADLYEDTLSIDREALEFVKNGKVVHQLREVETYILDDQGEPVEPEQSKGYKPIRSRQQWQLRPGQPGIAEMSASLEDLASAPDGDVVIDPIINFYTLDSTNTAMKDTFLDQNSTFPYGGRSLFSVEFDDRILTGFNISALGTDQYILDAYLKIYVDLNANRNDAYLSIYNVNTTWNEISANWFYPWSTAQSGDPDLLNPGSTVLLPGDTDDVWLTFDVKSLINARYPANMSDIYNKGFLIKFNSNPGEKIWVRSREYHNVNRRPQLVLISRCKCATTGGNGEPINYKFHIFVPPEVRPRINFDSIATAIADGANMLRTAYECPDPVNHPEDCVPPAFNHTVHVNYSHEFIELTEVEMQAFNLTDYVTTAAEEHAWRMFMCRYAPYARVVIFNYFYGISAFIMPANCQEDGYQAYMGLKFDASTNPYTWIHEHGHTVGLNHGNELTCLHNIMVSNSGRHGLTQAQAHAYYTAGSPDGCPTLGDSETPYINCP